MGRRDENAVGRDTSGLRGQLLRYVANGPWDHAAVDDGNRDAHLAPLKNEAAGLEVPRIHFAAATLGEPSADDVGVEGTRHVLNVGPCPQGTFVDLGGCNPRDEQGEEDGGRSDGARHNQGALMNNTGSCHLPREKVGQRIEVSQTLRARYAD